MKEQHKSMHSNTPNHTTSQHFCSACLAQKKKFSNLKFCCSYCEYDCTSLLVHVQCSIFSNQLTAPLRSVQFSSDRDRSALELVDVSLFLLAQLQLLLTLRLATSVSVPHQTSAKPHLPRPQPTRQQHAATASQTPHDVAWYRHTSHRYS